MTSRQDGDDLPSPKGGAVEASVAGGPGIINPTPTQPGGPPPEFYMQMLQQQRDMLQAITSLTPNKTVSTDRASPSALREAPPPRATLDFSRHQLSDGECSDPGDDLQQRFDALLESGDESDSEGDVFADIKNFFDKEEKLGPNVSDATADIVKLGMRTPVDGAKERELREKVLRPANCEDLSVPTVNKEIWDELSRHTHDSDMALQRIQRL